MSVTVLTWHKSQQNYRAENLKNKMDIENLKEILGVQQCQFDMKLHSADDPINYRLKIWKNEHLGRPIRPNQYNLVIVCSPILEFVDLNFSANYTPLIGPTRIKTQAYSS